LENNLEHNDHLYVVCKNSSLEAHECSFEWTLHVTD
jgi:hypothetical protein